MPAGFICVRTLSISLKRQVVHLLLITGHPALTTSATSQSKYIFTGVVPCLYEIVVLVGVEQCIQTLEMLFRHPDIARHVRKLVVRTGTNGSDISSVVRKVALRFDALNTFEWDGEEMPEEDIWFALRMLYVYHQFVSALYAYERAQVPEIETDRYDRWSRNAEAKQPRMSLIAACVRSPHEFHVQLFDFVDLLGFSITLKPSFYNNDVDIFHHGTFILVPSVKQ